MEKNKLKKIEWFNGKETNDLSEIYQKTGMLFALATKIKSTDKLQACHRWVKCRDYLPDAIRTTITKKPCQIYGFSYNLDYNLPIKMDKIRILVSTKIRKKDHKEETIAKKITAFREKKDHKEETIAEKITAFREKIKYSEKLVNHFEKYANITLTRVEEVDPTNSKSDIVFLFTGSRTWLSSPFLISLYTFLIRLGDKQIEFNNKESLITELKTLSKKDSNGDNDIEYLRKSWNKLHVIMKNRNKLFKKKKTFHDVYFKDTEIHAFHNMSGIQSLINSSTPYNKLNKQSKKLFMEEGL